MIGMLAKIAIIETAPNRADPPVEHVRGRDHVRPRLGVGDRLAHEELDGFVVDDLAVPDDPAMTVGCVFTEAHVRDEEEPGTSFLTARSASWTTPWSSYAPDPTSSFSAGMPKNITAGIPSACTSAHSRTIRSTDIWNTPGIDEISLFTFDPGTTKSGSMKSSGPSSVSRTIARSAGVMRSLRSRETGNGATFDSTMFMIAPSRL